MPSEFGESDFVDRDYQAGQKRPPSTVRPFAPATLATGRPPTREELDSQVTDTHQKLAELRQAQETLERERAVLEETRRRQTEFQTGRQEMIQHLTRGVGLLTEAEFAARRDAEQMGKTLADLQDALAKVQTVREETWTQESYQTELTRALTIIENARMEWNSARLKWPVLSGLAAEGAPQGEKGPPAEAWWSRQGFGALCRLGFALTWPLAAVGLVAALILLLVLWRR
jgi:hypothetical protein